MKKPKFKIETNKNQKVFLIELNVHSSKSNYNSYSLYKEGLFVKELKIVHQTNHKIVLSDEFVTVLDRELEGQKKESYKHCLDDISISIKTKETYFPNGIFCSVHTTGDVEKTILKIKQKIIRKINSEYGFLRNMEIENTIYNMEITETTK